MLFLSRRLQPPKQIPPVSSRTMTVSMPRHIASLSNDDSTRASEARETRARIFVCSHLLAKFEEALLRPNRTSTPFGTANRPKEHDIGRLGCLARFVGERTSRGVNTALIPDKGVCQPHYSNSRCWARKDGAQSLTYTSEQVVLRDESASVRSELFNGADDLFFFFWVPRKSAIGHYATSNKMDAFSRRVSTLCELCVTANSPCLDTFCHDLPMISSISLLLSLFVGMLIAIGCLLLWEP